MNIQAILANPFYAIEIEPTLALPHEPLVTRAMWVKSAAKLIEEIGPEAFLSQLLDCLEVQPRP